MAKISPKNIAQAIYEATNGKSKAEADAVLRKTVAMLAKKRAMGKSKEIIEALQNIIDVESGTVRAKILTSKKLSTGDRSKVEEDLKKKYKAEKVVSEFFEKEELLGGMRVEIKDEVIDNTYKNRLEQLEKHLTNKN
jgi:F-type H+-transporting ATPase subunit delta